MKLNTLLDPKIIKPLYEQGTSLLLKGPPGCGKSYTVRGIPKILSALYNEPFGYKEVLAPTFDAPDIKGYLALGVDPSGIPTADFTYPPIFPKPEYLAKHKRGILFIDEYGKSDQPTAKAFGPVILDKIMGEFSLPKGWWIVLATNNTEDRSGDSRMYMHLVNRLRIVNFDVDAAGWCDWAPKNELPSIATAFVKRRPGAVFASKVPSNPEPFCTPRSFTSAMQLVKANMGPDGLVPQDEYLKELVAGDIGSAMADEFFIFSSCQEFIPTIEEIKEDPDNAKVPGSDRLDACYAVMELCEYHINEDNIGRLWKYLIRLPKETLTLMAQSMVKKNPRLMLNFQPLKEFMETNRKLVRASVHGGV